MRNDFCVAFIVALAGVSPVTNTRRNFTRLSLIRDTFLVAVAILFMVRKYTKPCVQIQAPRSYSHNASVCASTSTSSLHATPRWMHMHNLSVWAFNLKSVDKIPIGRSNFLQLTPEQEQRGILPVGAAGNSHFVEISSHFLLHLWDKKWMEISPEDTDCYKKLTVHFNPSLLSKIK